MSWNKTAELKHKKIKLNNQNYDMLQNSFLTLLQEYQLIKEYSEKLENINYKDYEILTKKYHSKLVEIPKNISQIKTFLLEIKRDRMKYDESVFEQVLVIDTNLKQKEIDFQVVLNQIVSKEKSLTKRFSLIELPDSFPKDNEIMSVDSKRDSIMTSNTTYRK